MGDVDRDRDADVALGVEGSRDLLWLNDGRGRFTDVSAFRLPADLDDGLGVALADLDRDGDLDLVIANFRAPSRIYLNDGRGTFQDATAARLPDAVHVVRALAVVDVDADADLDLVFANDGRNALYRNDGRGFFTDASSDLPAVDLTSLALAAGDVDGDGDPDLVIGTDWQTVVHANDGRGRFADAPQSPVLRTNNPRALALLDADQDGDLDLVVGLPGGLFVNGGRGSFTLAPPGRMPTALTVVPTLAVADADRDGDLDLFLGSAHGEQTGFPSKLLLNRHRSLGAPYWPRPGRAWLLDVQSMPGYAAGLQLVVPLFSPGVGAPLDHPLFGRFVLDPSRMTIGLVDALPAPAGVKTLALRLPAVPSLAGQTIAAQALVLSSLTDPRLWRLTNGVAETVR